MTNLGLIVIYFVVVLVAISVHESAHALMSYLLGDDTARLQNRISLNPLNHIDPFMSVLLPVMLMMMNLPAFGGAKPVIINSRKIKYSDYGMALVALAGPMSNFLLAFLCFGGSALALKMNSEVLASLLLMSVRVNLGFMLFNLLPIPPLDGSRVVYALLPDSLQVAMQKIEQWGMILMLGLVIVFNEVIFLYVSSVGQLITEIFALIVNV